MVESSGAFGWASPQDFNLPVLHLFPHRHHTPIYTTNPKAFRQLLAVLNASGRSYSEAVATPRLSCEPPKVTFLLCGDSCLFFGLVKRMVLCFVVRVFMWCNPGVCTWRETAFQRVAFLLTRRRRLISTVARLHRIRMWCFRVAFI